MPVFILNQRHLTDPRAYTCMLPHIQDFSGLSREEPSMCVNDHVDSCTHIHTPTTNIVNKNIVIEELSNVQRQQQQQKSRRNTPA